MLQIRLRPPLFSESSKPEQAIVSVGRSMVRVGEAPTGVTGAAIMIGALALLSALAWMAFRKAS